MIYVDVFMTQRCQLYSFLSLIDSLGFHCEITFCQQSLLFVLLYQIISYKIPTEQFNKFP